jgi:hypothetical protein
MKTTETHTTILATDCRENESTDTPRTDAKSVAHFEGFCVSIAFARELEREIEETENEYLQTAFALTKQTERAEKAEAEVERLKELFNKLAEEVECGPECFSRFGDHCNCSRLKRANKVIIDFEELTNTKNGTTKN